MSFLIHQQSANNWQLVTGSHSSSIRISNIQQRLKTIIITWEMHLRYGSDEKNKEDANAASNENRKPFQSNDRHRMAIK